MLALNQEDRHIDLSRPQGDRIHRQITRIIRHLRDQFQQQNPNTTMPSDWLLEQLVMNGAKKTILTKSSWQLRVTMTLKEIVLDCNDADCHYINSHNKLPLFPNSELFEPWEVRQSMQRLLAYLVDEQF